MLHTLYGSRGSGSAAIEMALRAAALEYRTVRASQWEAESAHAELLGVNPLGQIPTLILPDGTVMTESAAILIHLGLEHPQSGLLPLAPAARATALRGLLFIAANCYAGVSVSDYPERWTTATDPAARIDVRDAARRQLHRHWEIFADAFDSDAHLPETDPGALAFLAVVVSQWSGARAHLRLHRPDFHARLLRIEGHPRVAAVLDEHRAT
jgi:GST-like protein